MDLDRFPKGQNTCYLFNSFKSQWGDRRLNFVIFVVCRALIVGGWVGRVVEQKTLFKTALNWIFCVPCFIQGWRRRVSPKFHLFFDAVNQ